MGKYASEHGSAALYPTLYKYGVRQKKGWSSFIIFFYYCNFIKFDKIVHCFHIIKYYLLRVNMINNCAVEAILTVTVILFEKKLYKLITML